MFIYLLNVNINIVVDNVAVELVKEIKYLDVIFDDKLIFKNHIEYVCKKLSKKIYFFSKIKFFLVRCFN